VRIPLRSRRRSSRRAIPKGGPADRSKVTSYLGRTKNVFDNVKGQGYGLKEWREPAGAARERSV